MNRTFLLLSKLYWGNTRSILRLVCRFSAPKKLLTSPKEAVSVFFVCVCGVIMCNSYQVFEEAVADPTWVEPTIAATYGANFVHGYSVLISVV